MTQEQMRWQEDGRRAFDWIAKVYAQTRAVWDDAQSTFTEDGWTVRSGSGWGGAAMGLSLDQWPFTYFKAFCVTPPGVSENADTGVAAVFGFFFHDGVRQGPQCFGGRVSWSKVEAHLDHWFLFHAMGDDGTFERLASTEPGIRIARPTGKGQIRRPGADELRWFELPLSALASAEELQNVVRATQSLVLGNEQPAGALRRALELNPTKP